MAIAQTKLECVSCGASSFSSARNALLKCEYCGTVSIVQGIHEPSTDELKAKLTERTRSIDTVLKKAANYLYKGVSDGGWLHVTKRELVFVPHMLNLNTGYRLVFPFSETRDVRKRSAWAGLSRQLIVAMKDGSESAFVIWGRDEVIECIRSQLG
jgi:hypothetical protein